MTPKILAAALAAGALLAALPAVRAAETDLQIEDFKTSLTNWKALKIAKETLSEDADAKLTVTRDAGEQAGLSGAILYRYDLTPGVVRALARATPTDLTDRRSLRFWVKCSTATALSIGLAAQNGASYQTGFYVPKGAWQEVRLNLDELAAERGKDPGGKLDLAHVQAITLADLGPVYAAFAPGSVTDTPRFLRVADMVFSSQAAPVVTGRVTTPEKTTIYRVDSFETPLIRWIPLRVELADKPVITLFTAPVTVVLDAPTGGGRQSLRYTYTRASRRIEGLMRSLENMDLARATTLSLWLKTGADGTLVVSIEQKDGTRFQKILPLAATDGWKQYTIPLIEFTAEKGGNTHPRADQLKELSLADMTPLTGGGEGANTLWLDEVQFALSSAP